MSPQGDEAIQRGARVVLDCFPRFRATACTHLGRIDMAPDGYACSYPPARWRGGSVGGLRPPFLVLKNAGAERRLRAERAAGGGGYSCSEFAEAPPTPNPSPPFAARMGGGEPKDVCMP